MKLISRFLLLMLLLAASCLWAADIDKELEEGLGRCQMSSCRLSRLRKSDLFRVGAITDTHYFIDGSTISVGADQVIRYTLVIVSSSGAQNISYEGMRCLTAEKRVLRSSAC